MYLAVQPPDDGRLLMKKTPDQDFAGGKTTTVDVVLGPGAVLVGQVATSKGKAVVGAQVSVQPKGGGGQFYPYQPPRATVSGPGGAFRIEPLAPGTYDVHCTSPDPALRAGATAVAVAGQGEQKVRIVLYLTGSVTGVARDAKGRPLGQGTAWVSLQPAGEARQQGGSSQLDDQGRYKIGGLTPGKYTLTVGLGQKGQKMGLDRPAPAEIIVEEGKETKHDVTVPYGPEGKAPDF